MPQWPPRIPRAGGGPTPPGGADIRAPKLIVGNEPAGDTIDVCDILDPGDGTGIAAAFAAASATGGDIWLRPGRYNTGLPSSPALPLTVPGGVTIRGAGSQPDFNVFGPGVSAAVIVVGDNRTVFTSDTFADLIDVYFEVAPVDVAASGAFMVSINFLRLTRVSVFLPFGPNPAETLEWLFAGARVLSQASQVLGSYANGEAGGTPLGSFLSSECIMNMDWIFGVDRGAEMSSGSVTGANIRTALQALELRGYCQVSASNLQTESALSSEVIAVSGGDAQITGNTIRGDAGQGAVVTGVSVGGGSRATVVGNQVDNCAVGVGIALGSASTVGFNNLLGNFTGIDNLSTTAEIGHNLLPEEN